MSAEPKKQFLMHAEELVFGGSHRGHESQTDDHVEIRCLNPEQSIRFDTNTIEFLDGAQFKSGDVEFYNGAEIKSGDLKLASSSTLDFNNCTVDNVDFTGATLSGTMDFSNVTVNNLSVDSGTFTADNILSSNEYNTLDDEIDAIRTHVNLLQSMTSGLTTGKVLIANGAGLIKSSSIDKDKVVVTTNGLIPQSQIPNLPASRINEGAFHEDRVPPLPASRITSGTLDDARIPSLAASKITTGAFDVDRIPELSASKITSDTLNAARVPNLDAAKIATGTLGVDRIPSLPASKITSDTFDAARIPELDASKITTGTISDARLNSNILRNNFDNQTLSANNFTIDAGNSGDAVLTLRADADNNNEGDNAFIDFLQDGANLGTNNGTRGRIGLDSANNLFCGIVPNSGFFGGVELRTVGSGTGTNYKPVIFKPHGVQTAVVDHLGINILSGYNLRFSGSNLAFTNIAGTAAESQVPSLPASKIDSGTLSLDRIPTLTAAKIPELSAGKITTDTFNVARIPTLTVSKIPSLNASKINSGTFTADRIPELPASKITTGTLQAAQIPSLPQSKITNLETDLTTLQTSISGKQNLIGNGDLSIDHVADLQSKLDDKQDTITTNSLQISHVTDLQSTLNDKQDLIENGDLNIDHVNLLQTSLNAKQDNIGVGDLIIANTADLQSTLDAKASINNPVFKTNNSLMAAGFCKTDNNGVMTSGHSIADSDVPDALTLSTLVGVSNNGFLKVSGGNGTIGVDQSDYLKTDGSNHLTGIGSTTLKVVSNSDVTNVTPTFILVKNEADGTLVAQTSLFQYATHLQFHPQGHSKFSFGQIDLDDGDINLPANKEFKIGGTNILDNVVKTNVNNQQITCNTFTFSADNSGTCNVILEADADNNDDNDTPKITFKQDGGIVAAHIGTQAGENAMYLQTNDAVRPILFKLGNTERARVKNSGISLPTGNTYQINNQQISTAALSDHADIVKTSGTQTIDGAKTFSGTVTAEKYVNPSDSTETNSFVASNFSGQVEASTFNSTSNYKVNGTQISSANLSDNADIVKTSGTQTIGGAKTFSDAATFSASLSSTHNSATGTGIVLSNGRIGTSTGHKRQISMGYNGTSNYQHHIATNHDSGTITNNKMEFYLSDGTAQSNTLPTTNVRRALGLFTTSDGGSTAKVYGKSECDSLTAIGAVECASLSTGSITHTSKLTVDIDEPANSTIFELKATGQAGTSAHPVIASLDSLGDCRFKVNGYVESVGGFIGQSGISQYYSRNVSNTNAASPPLWSGFMRLQSVMGENRIDSSQIVRFDIVHLPLTAAQQDYVSGLCHTTEPTTARYSNSVTPVLEGNNTNDLNIFSVSHNPAAGSSYSRSIYLNETYSWDPDDNAFLTGVGYVNFGHGGWVNNNIRNKNNKILRISVHADDACRLSVDGRHVINIKYSGSESVSGTGNDVVHAITTCHGEYACIEFEYCGGGGSNYLSLTFSVLAAWD